MPLHRGRRRVGSQPSAGRGPYPRSPASLYCTPVFRSSMRQPCCMTAKPLFLKRLLWMSGVQTKKKSSKMKMSWRAVTN